jgi:hypothetical protein
MLQGLSLSRLTFPLGKQEGTGCGVRDGSPAACEIEASKGRSKASK